MKVFDADGLIKTAIKSVPVVRYALGLAAIAILVSIARGANPDIGPAGMVPVITGTLILMILLIIVAAISESKSVLAGPAVLITWSASIALVVVLAASVSAMLTGWPPQWARLILPKTAADKPLISVDRISTHEPSASETPNPSPRASMSPAATPPQITVNKAPPTDQPTDGLEAPPQKTTSRVTEKPFDCRKAVMPLDWAICADDEAYNLNTRMGALWESTHRQMDRTERRAHVQDQLNWIYSIQRQCGLPAKGKPEAATLNAAAPCVRSAYSKHIDAMQ